MMFPIYNSSCQTNGRENSTKESEKFVLRLKVSLSDFSYFSNWIVSINFADSS